MHFHFHWNRTLLEVRTFSGHTLYDIEEALAKNKGVALCSQILFASGLLRNCHGRHRGKAPTTNNGVGTLVKAMGEPAKPLAAPSKLPPLPPEVAKGSKAGQLSRYVREAVLSILNPCFSAFMQKTSKNNLEIFVEAYDVPTLKQMGYTASVRPPYLLGGETAGLARMATMLKARKRLPVFFPMIYDCNGI